MKPDNPKEMNGVYQATRQTLTDSIGGGLGLH